MQLAVVHYHLERGGVTQLIRNQFAALAAASPRPPQIDVVLLHGGRCGGWPEGERHNGLSDLQIRLRAVEGLDYDAGIDADTLARRLRAALHEFGGNRDTTVVHVHNHALGKNPALPGALRILAGDGFRLLLQIHDFAEDFRPGVYRGLCQAWSTGDGADPGRILYPQAEHIHYAALNSRDCDVLRRAGCHRSRLHLMPNCVVEPGTLPARNSARLRLERQFGVARQPAYVLYPVRGIARKNVGELLFLSALAAGQAHFGLTLAPANPRERPLYQRWRQLAGDLRLPCLLEVGGHNGLGFLENLAAADRIVTTSLAEGFGMAFLESWLADRPLAGRDLPEITVDFRAAGIDLHALYARISVPMDWIGWRSFSDALSAAYTHVLSAYGLDFPAPQQLQAEIKSLVQADTVDFGVLVPELQAAVIRRAHDDASQRRVIRDLNPGLSRTWQLPTPEEMNLVQQNARRVRASYTADVCGNRLLLVYRKLLDADAGPLEAEFISSRRILQEFLRLDRFHPLRSGLY